MKVKLKSVFLIAIAAIAVLVSVFTAVTLRVDAESAAAEPEQTAVPHEESDGARGIYTSLSIALNGGDGKVWVTVKNAITIFPATVQVIVELYSSDEYFESYTDMTLVSRTSIADLDMGKTITAEGSTGGAEKYWLGRARYKVDSGAWKELNTGTYLFDEDGNYLGLGV